MPAPWRGRGDGDAGGDAARRWTWGGSRLRKKQKKRGGSERWKRWFLQTCLTSAMVTTTQREVTRCSSMPSTTRREVPNPQFQLRTTMQSQFQLRTPNSSSQLARSSGALQHQMLARSSGALQQQIAYLKVGAAWLVLHLRGAMAGSALPGSGLQPGSGLYPGSGLPGSGLQPGSGLHPGSVLHLSGRVNG